MNFQVLQKCRNQSQKCFRMQSNFQQLQLRKKKTGKPLWKSAFDQRTGRTYYYNRVTKKTQWKKPDDFETAKVPTKDASLPLNPTIGSVAASSASIVTSQNMIAPRDSIAESPRSSLTYDKGVPAAVVPKKKKEKKIWREVVDKKSGRTYYYNRKTKKTQWQKPDELKPDDPTPDVPIVTRGHTASGSEIPILRPPSEPPSLRTSLVQMGGMRSSTSDMKIPDKKYESTRDEKKTLDFDANILESFDKGLQQQQPKTLIQMIHLRHFLIFKRRRLENDLDSDDDDDLVGGRGYEFTKHRHGFINRILRRGTPHDAEQLLTYKKSLIKKSLLKANRPRDKQAIQMFKNIMSFMGDRESSKDHWGHAKKIIKNALKAPMGMRDEIFLQLCKQTNGNPNAQHCKEGWNLMLICLCAFPPSKNIRIRDYIQKTLTMSKKNLDRGDGIIERAELALMLLDVIDDFGERMEVPTELEVHSIRQMKLIQVPIMTPDKTGKNHKLAFSVNIGPFFTVSELEAVVIRKFGIKFMKVWALTHI